MSEKQTVEQVIDRKYRDEELEKELLAFVVRKHPEIVGRINPEWFGLYVYKSILEIVRENKAILSQHALVVALKQAKAIKKGDGGVADILIEQLYEARVSTLSVKSVELHIKTLSSLWQSRNVLSGLSDVVRDVKNNRFDLDKVLGMFHGFFTASKISTDDDFTYGEGVENRIEVLEERRRKHESGEDIGIPTGVRVFDQLFGGLQKTEFGVIAGQPGVGKTALLGLLASHAWKSGKGVMFASGEMSKIDVETRFDSDVANIPATKFRFGKLSNKDIAQLRKRVENETSMSEGFLEIVSFSRSFTTADIEAAANHCQDKNKHSVELICIDYLNIMGSIGVGKFSPKDWQAQAEAIWDVKALCADFNNGISIWTAGQVKDEAMEKSRLSLGDLKYSRAISETAPVVVGLVKNTDDAYEHTLEMQVLKMRNAELTTRSIILRPNLEYMRIHEEVGSRVKDIRYFDPEMVERKNDDNDKKSRGKKTVSTRKE